MANPPDPKTTGNDPQRGSFDPLSILVIIGAATYFFISSEVHKKHDHPLLLITLMALMPVAIGVPLVIMRGIRNGMSQEKSTLLVLLILYGIGLTVVGYYSTDPNTVYIFPIISIFWTIYIAIGELFRKK